MLSSSRPTSRNEWRDGWAGVDPARPASHDAQTDRGAGMTTEHADGRPEAEGTPSPAGEGAARAARRPGETDDLDGLSPEELRERVREARAEAQRNWQQFLHSAADLENYKKLAIRDRQ